MASLESNAASIMRGMSQLHPQYRFAAAKALTDTMRTVRGKMPAAIESELDRPTEFTRRGFFAAPARKDRLVAAVGIMPKQAEYLVFQVEGGKRTPGAGGLRLPSDIQLNAHGNIPRGFIKALVARASAGKRATKGQAARFGVSSGLDLFVGEPGGGRPRGIYKRVTLSPAVHRLVPVVVFPRRAADYSARRFDFYAHADRAFRAAFPAALDAAWRFALATAR